ncbi:High-affinity nitrate transporter 3.1 [Citrus sinensis]|uniref:High-affinity nitrate transporter 3.1 n=1 Tax=Citrus sinensis TaxID=2711 RepID=A0ACB8LHR2_CITSI|nr:High-affinity nitrate transporter 3.1 [Citrus sinensis]
MTGLGIIFNKIYLNIHRHAYKFFLLFLKAGDDKITVSWSLNRSFRATDDLYKNVKVTLCYAPASQVDGAWAKTEDDMTKERTCQFTIMRGPYNDAPEASYFVTVYASDSAGKEVGVGQTFGARKSSNLFEIHAISERHLSLEISSMCFSFFPAVSLFGFYFVERSKRKGSQGIERR